MGAPAPDDARLEAERASAAARVAALTADWEGIVAGSAGANGDDEHDPEGSTVAFERARTAALLDEARHHLAALDRAAARMEDGTYGQCHRCGGTIATERLAALPATTTCRACADAGPPG